MATIPTTYRAFQRTAGIGMAEKPITIEPITRTLPNGGKLGPHDVLTRIRAVSLNFRDIAILTGRYTTGTADGGIPASDCAAEVTALGSSVTDFQVGDRVSPIFSLGNITGYEEGLFSHNELGGDIDGVLREYAVFEDKVLVHLPKNLTWEEASTISCAGVTAWNAIGAPGSFDKGKTALLQGTGGVSMFSLLIALAGGVKPIITSSSDEKLAAIKKLAPPGKIGGYNYKTNPDQPVAVKALTGGKGVDIVVNNCGPQSIPEDIASLRRHGTVSLVGMLEGLAADWNPAQLLTLISKNGRLQAIAVGSKLDFQALNDFIETNEIKLEVLVDRVFEFDDSEAAFQYLGSGKHVGKVVIKM
ncbi:alcohol dehydrogenase [Lasiosphaeria hispida]|uniref:Alcohol dehydrogenase n=1 Tax=Lasiosphaeria hispida TaxID=260671 RepID=A0AAJ0HGW3_9PEZI|nr:alcohol dehydrogenase [Lasiosphaeria hispida]